MAGPPPAPRDAPGPARAGGADIQTRAGGLTGPGHGPGASAAARTRTPSRRPTPSQPGRWSESDSPVDSPAADLSSSGLAESESTVRLATSDHESGPSKFNAASAKLNSY